MLVSAHVCQYTIKSVGRQLFVKVNVNTTRRSGFLKIFLNFKMTIK